MENKFKLSIWERFWESHNLLSEDEEIVNNALNLGETELLNMVVKEAVEKVPHNKIAPSDRMKIGNIDLDFCNGTTIKMNKMSIARPVTSITNLNPFTSFINVQVITITYLNSEESCESDTELMLEGDLHNTKLFQHFPRLRSITLIEICYDGIRKIECIRT